MAHKVEGACAPIEFLVMGLLDNNVYIVDDGAGCFVVDPSCEPERILEALGGRAVDAVFITHGHWDHTGAAEALREASGAPVIASAVDAPVVTGERPLGGHHRLSMPCPVDRTVEDGDILEIGNMKWRVIATPGHTLGSVCLYLEPPADQGGAPVLISGDTLFEGTHGRTDFAESDPAAMRMSLKRLAELPGETIVLPGHNGFTTIARERSWLKRGGLAR